jgi:hypothetical protein
LLAAGCGESTAERHDFQTGVHTVSVSVNASMDRSLRQGQTLGRLATEGHDVGAERARDVCSRFGGEPYDLRREQSDASNVQATFRCTGQSQLVWRSGKPAIELAPLPSSTKPALQAEMSGL